MMQMKNAAGMLGAAGGLSGMLQGNPYSRGGGAGGLSSGGGGGGVPLSGNAGAPQGANPTQLQQPPLIPVIGTPEPQPTNTPAPTPTSRNSVISTF